MWATHTLFKLPEFNCVALVASPPLLKYLPTPLVGNPIIKILDTPLLYYSLLWMVPLPVVFYLETTGINRSWPFTMSLKGLSHTGHILNS